MRMAVSDGFDSEENKKISEKKWGYPEIKFSELRVGDKILTNGSFCERLDYHFVYGEVKCIHNHRVCIKNYVCDLQRNEDWKGKKIWNKGGGCEGSWWCSGPLETDQDLKLYLVERAEERKELIIRCPTKELWIKVVQKLLDEGYMWASGHKEIPVGYWHEGSCIYLSREDDLVREDNLVITTIHRVRDEYSHIPITPAEEFLREKGEEEVSAKKESDARAGFKEVCAKQEANSEQQTAAIVKQILFWYCDEYLSEESGEYPLLDIRKAVLRMRLLNDKELAGLLKRHSEPSEESRMLVPKDNIVTSSFRKAAKNLGVFLYQMITGKSEYTDISFHLDGYPPIRKFNLQTSSSLNEIIENLANGKYRDIQKLRDDIWELKKEAEDISDPTDDNSSNSEDASPEEASMPPYGHLGACTYVTPDKNKQPSKSASVPEWVVYQGVMVRNPDFAPLAEPLEPHSNKPKSYRLYPFF